MPVYTSLQHTDISPICLSSCLFSQEKDTHTHSEGHVDALRDSRCMSSNNLLLSSSPCRRSTRWWARWSWWKWTRTAWRPSRGWTRSSPRWIRTTTTRSRWMSSKRRPRATRPSYYCCSVTSRNRPEGERSAPPAATDCTERISCSIQFAAISTEKKKYAWTTFQWICFLCLKHSCAWECYLL